MNGIINKLHKFFFPKHHRALMRAFDVSWVYWHKSPNYSKQEVGEDIYMKLAKILE